MIGKDLPAVTSKTDPRTERGIGRDGGGATIDVEKKGVEESVVRGHPYLLDFTIFQRPNAPPRLRHRVPAHPPNPLNPLHLIYLDFATVPPLPGASISTRCPAALDALIRSITYIL